MANAWTTGYCKHMSECDEIVERIVAGDTHFTLDDYFDQNDLDYIKNRLHNEFGINVSLNYI